VVQRYIRQEGGVLPNRHLEGCESEVTINLRNPKKKAWAKRGIYPVKEKRSLVKRMRICSVCAPEGEHLDEGSGIQRDVVGKGQEARAGSFSTVTKRGRAKAA